MPHNFFLFETLVQLGRCNYLTPSQLWALKIACVLCVAKSRFSSDFTADDVRRVHPVDAYAAFLDADLDVLVDARFLATGALFSAPQRERDDVLSPTKVRCRWFAMHSRCCTREWNASG